ncbi:MAG: HlyC/CorC family transporter [Gammaproteobacteria bacterium]|nr:HlyC/CorC family transporter [Gammaproteobacteria bacterium]
MVDLALTILLLVANFLFVGTEFAITRLRPTQLTELERKGTVGVKSARHAVDHIDAYLSACQLGITLASIGLGVVGKPFFQALFKPLIGDASAYTGFAVAAGLAFATVTLLHVVLGELVPKSLAISRTVPIALLFAPPMRLFYLLTKPVVDLFNAMGNLILKPFGVPPAREVGHTPHSEDELRELLRQSAAEGLIDIDERRFTENVFSFGERRTRDIMLPRPNVEFVTVTDDLRAIAARLLASGRTRLPLCDGEQGLDASIGLVHAKDLLRAVIEDEKIKPRDIARPLPRVSESILIDELLRDLRRDRNHMALVADEHGITVGLVTLEDILEEIVGEIEDEFDTDRVELIVEEGECTRVAGSASIRLVVKRLNVEIANPHEATIGGHVTEMLGRLPQVGEIVQLNGHAAKVTGVDETRITELTFENEPQPHKPGSEAEALPPPQTQQQDAGR